MSTTEQQEVNVPIEQPAANSAFEEDIISQQAGPEAAAVDQEPTQEQSTSVDYEAESKSFNQCMIVLKPRMQSCNKVLNYFSY